MHLPFSGQEVCQMDTTGRIKLSAKYLRDFEEAGAAGKVIVQCLMPEGAIGLHPPPAWDSIRQRELGDATRQSNPVVFRRDLRRLGSLAEAVEISNQGRVTLPVLFRQHAGLPASGEVLIIGTTQGLEIWTRERYLAEMERANREQDARHIPLSAPSEQRP